MKFRTFIWCVLILMTVVSLHSLAQNIHNKSEINRDTEIVRYIFDKNTGDVYFPEINPDNKKLKSVSYSCEDELCLLNLNY